MSVRAMPTAPAKMVTHAILGNPGERVVQRIDADLEIAAIVSNARLRLDHVPGCHDTGIVDLQDKSGVDDSAIFLAHRVGQSEHEFLFVPIMLVVDEMIEPARREHADESLLGAAGDLQCLLEDIDLAPYSIGCPALDRSGDDHFLPRRKKPGLFDGHAACRTDMI